ncbi:integrator complex subunit 9-like isoform X2 [Artemia franciscana]|uniref:Beta-Casp domain-containing protein n=1 Tax=Artemia franciscana TaxID=6661 RepID=A0AA88I8C5_ARTSF|nr:hypothetical protein QYM36_003898 [Artemia franciscana]
MKLFSISPSPYRPCFLLKIQGITIMLDCPLDVSAGLNFIPLHLIPPESDSSTPWCGQDGTEHHELREIQGRVFVDGVMEFGLPLDTLVPYSEIDVILISNYQNILALPYITEETGFSGCIFATEPTIQIGRLYMEELLSHVQRSPKLSNPQEWKKLISLPSPLSSTVRPQLWVKLFTRKKMNLSLGRIQSVGYNQKLEIYGSIRISPVSSGYAIGSANWIVSTESSKVVYVSTTSTLTTHPRAIDQSSLKNADCLILGGNNQTSTTIPDSNIMLGEVFMNAVVTLKSGGNVLFPVYSAGLVYDLFEFMSTHLDNQGLSQIPLYFISGVAESSLAYSNIFAEWLSASKQKRVYLPEEPFPHAFLVKNNRLKHFKSICDENFTSEYRQPCVVFTGHPSLRFGDVVQFITTWKSNPLNAIIFTEPEFNHLDALAPYFPLAMKVLRFPIDTSLSPLQSVKLVRDSKPGTVVAFDELVKSGINFDPDIRLKSMKRLDVLEVPLDTSAEHLLIDSTMAKKIQLKKLREQFMCSITGQLDLKDNNFILKEGHVPVLDSFVPIEAEDLVNRLKTSFSDVVVSKEGNVTKITLSRDDAAVVVNGSRTAIECENATVRRKVTESLLLPFNQN